MARSNGIELDLSYEVIQDGWVGKPKGMKQICFERRLIDISRHKSYNKDGSIMIDGNKVKDENFSLTKLLNECNDFQNELTLLQHSAATIGNNRNIKITVDRSPKCHPEVAGEGIEYTWARCKSYL